LSTAYIKKRTEERWKKRILGLDPLRMGNFTTFISQCSTVCKENCGILGKKVWDFQGKKKSANHFLADNLSLISFAKRYSSRTFHINSVFHV